MGGVYRGVGCDERSEGGDERGGEERAGPPRREMVPDTFFVVSRISIYQFVSRMLSAVQAQIL
jgi:hypothetical protein